MTDRLDYWLRSQPKQGSIADLTDDQAAALRLTAQLALGGIAEMEEEDKKHDPPHHQPHL